MPAAASTGEWPLPTPEDEAWGRIDTHLQPDLWPAMIDPTQIVLVILNLAINARDAMEVGGALTMNAGCYGRETREVLVSAWGYDRTGARRDFALADFGYTYRHSEAPADIVWVEATYEGTADDPAAIQARMAEITARLRQASAQAEAAA